MEYTGDEEMPALFTDYFAVATKMAASFVRPTLFPGLT